MADVSYLSRVRVEPVKGRVRRAFIPAEDEPVFFGVHDEVAEHYGVEPGAEEPHASTLDYVVAAAGGCCLGPSGARWQRVRFLTRASARRRWGR
jgi:hypothetical protein